MSMTCFISGYESLKKHIYEVVSKLPKWCTIIAVFPVNTTCGKGDSQLDKY